MDDKVLDQCAALKSLGLLDGLKEAALYDTRRPWLTYAGRIAPTAVFATSAFVRDASQRVRHAQEVVGPDEMLDDLADVVATVCSQLEQPTSNVATIAAGLVGMSVRLPEVRARLRQDAGNGDPLRELRDKIEEQQEVVKNLDEDVKTMRFQPQHLTAVVKQSGLNLAAAERGRTRRVEGLRTQLPPDPLEIGTAKHSQAAARAAEAALPEIVTTVATAYARAVARLDQLKRALPDE